MGRTGMDSQRSAHINSPFPVNSGRRWSSFGLPDGEDLVGVQIPQNFPCSVGPDDLQAGDPIVFELMEVVLDGLGCS